MSRARRSLTALIAVAAFAAACGTTPNATFYTLRGDTELGTTDASSISVVVGPVTLPDAVDRPQLVINTTGNRVRIEEFHRWAEPLRNEIPQVLAAQLGRELRTPRTASFSDVAISDPDFRVLIDLQRFESRPSEAATVDALWTIRSRDNRTHIGRTLAREPAAGGYDALVAAHARALATVSRAIAEGIRSMQR